MTSSTPSTISDQSPRNIDPAYSVTINKPSRVVPPWVRCLGSGLNLSGRVNRRWTSQRLTGLWFSVFKSRPKPWVHTFWSQADASVEIHLMNQSIPVYLWGRGPLVVCLHGWSGSGTQFRSLIPGLVKQGYRVAVFDAPAHGSNPGKSTNVLEIAQCLLAIEQQLGAIDTVVAHSFGGMATLTAAWQGLTARRMVMIAPGLDVAELFDSFCDGLGLNDHVREPFYNQVGQMMADMALQPDVWRFFSPEVLMEYASEEGLLIYDEQDEELSVQSLLRAQKAWPTAQTFSTKGLGHYRILRDEQVMQRIVDWLGNAPLMAAIR